MSEQREVVDDPVYADPNQEDIGDLSDLDGEEIPEEEADGLDDLLAGVDPAAGDEPVIDADEEDEK